MLDVFQIQDIFSDPRKDIKILCTRTLLNMLDEQKTRKHLGIY